MAGGAEGHRSGTGVPQLVCRKRAQRGAGVLQLGCRDTMVRVVGRAGSRGQGCRGTVVRGCGLKQRAGRAPWLGLQHLRYWGAGAAWTEGQRGAEYCG